MTYSIQSGQNYFDVVMNTYGTLDQFVKFLVDNSISWVDIPNMESINFDTSLVDDVNIYNNTTGEGIFFATGSLPNIEYLLSETGVILRSETGEPLRAET